MKIVKAGVVTIRSDDKGGAAIMIEKFSFADFTYDKAAELSLLWAIDKLESELLSLQLNKEE